MPSRDQNAREGPDIRHNYIKVNASGDTIFVDSNRYLPNIREDRVARKLCKHKPKDPKPKEWLASEHSLQKIANYKPFNFVDGEGVRCSSYVSGCLFDCPSRYNLIAQNFNYDRPYTQELEDQVIKDMSEDYVQSLTLLGGEPFLDTQVCLKIVNRICKEFWHKKDIWSWSGYTCDELVQESGDKLELLSKIDILVDGRFEEDLKDLTLQFRGSSNQRIIDMPASSKAGKVVVWKNLAHWVGAWKKNN